MHNITVREPDALTSLTRKGTHEFITVGPEPTDEFVPRRSCIRKRDDPPDHLPCLLDLLLAYARLIGVQRDGVDVLERFFAIHFDELANVAPDERGEVECHLAVGEEGDCLFYG